MSKSKVGPSMRKGQLVRTTARSHAWRRLTEEEINAWYEHFYAECRAGREIWHDDAGESKLAPREEIIIVPIGTVCEVIRARVAAQYGYSTVSGCCAVSIPSLGQSEVFLKRRYLEVSW